MLLSRRRLHSIPGPGRNWPWQRLQRPSWEMLIAWLAWRAEFGDVIRLAAWPRPVLLISHPDAVQVVLRDHAANYRKGVLFKPIAALQGQGLLTSEGALWRQQRRLLQPAFQPRYSAAAADIIVEEAQAIAQSWRQVAPAGEPINIAAWMHRLTFRIVGRVLLGLAPEALDDIGRQLQTIAAALRPRLASRAVPRRFAPLSTAIVQRRRFGAAVAAYHALAQHIITVRRQTLRHSETSPGDVLALLLAAQEEMTEARLSDQQLRDEVITFIGAGVETSAQVLSWAWHLLAQHPGERQQLQAELDTVLGGRLPMPADVPHLPYSRMILDEAMRLYPPSALLPRQANRADVIGGYTVPKNAVVVMSQYVTHRHPDFWPQPETFQPQRFTPTQVAARHRFAYFPFGDGPRVCIGKSLALMEMHLVLATLAQIYTLQSAPGQPVLPVLATTLQPQHGLWMTVHERG